MTAFALSATGASAWQIHECDRDAFGSYIQRDYKDTRARILESRALDPDAVEYRVANNGRIYVVRGSWRDRFTGTHLIDIPADDVEIDHVVPLCWAWVRGAATWHYETRRKFNNDERYLIVVASDLNAAKGDRGPEDFTPLNREFACEYVELFLAGVTEYRLQLSPDDQEGLEEARKAACDDADPLLN